jgi:hypothetical protein
VYPAPSGCDDEPPPVGDAQAASGGHELVVELLDELIVELIGRKECEYQPESDDDQ